MMIMTDNENSQPERILSIRHVDVDDVVVIVIVMMRASWSYRAIIAVSLVS